MMKLLVYTFRTFPCIEELKKEFGEIFILERLKDDLGIFFKLVLKEKPTMILGVALSGNNCSYFEPKTVNIFNKNKKIIKNRKEELSLFVPEIRETNFKISLRSTSSFCNYSMYLIKSFLEQEKLTIPFVFTHIKKEDIKSLKKILIGQQSYKSRGTF